MAQATKSNDGRWMAMLFICISLLVISLDNTILNVALPSIANQLGASATDLQWIVDAYILIFAALLLTMGAVGDRYGRKRALQIGLFWFGIGSLGAALSTSTEMLIASRAFLGIGGAIIMPATLSIVTAMFTDHKERSQAIAIWAAMFGLGVGLGPLTGGWLLERFDWNSVFFINLPVIAVALIGGHFFIRESKDEHAPSPDIPGVILSIIGLFALVYGIIEAGVEGWTATNVIVAFAVAVVTLGLFAIWESRAPNAMLPIHFFKNMSFTGANTALALVVFGLFGSIFFLSQYFQSVQGYSALDAGVRVLPMALTLMFSAAFSARVSARLGVKLSVGIGILIAATGMFYMSQMIEVDTAYPTVLVGLVILAVGMGMAMPPATDSVMGSVPVNKAGIGSAMNDTTRELGGALGVAVLGTIVNNHYLDRMQSMNAAPIMNMVPAEAKEALTHSIQAAHAIANQLPLAPVSNLIRDTSNQAFVEGMVEAMLIGSAIMVAASLITFLILPSVVRTPKEETEGEITALPEGAVPAIGD